VQQAEKKVMEAELAYKTADIAFLTKRQKLHDELAWYQEPSVVARLRLRMERMRGGVLGLKHLWEKRQAELVEARLEAVRQEAAKEIAGLRTQLEDALELARRAQDAAQSFQILHNQELISRNNKRIEELDDRARAANEEARVANEEARAWHKHTLWLTGVL